MWILLLACQHSTPSSDSATSSTTTPPTTPTPTGTTGTTGTTAETGTVPQVPMIIDVMRKLCPDAAAGEPLPVGKDMHKVTLNGLGRCNDGSSPALYVLAATDPKHANDWVWFFDGGNFCADWLGCQIRWCNLNPPFGRRHMSSNTYPDLIAAEGIFSPMEENAFRGWNRVYAAYCSSDSWTGRATDVVFDELKPAFRLHFEGALVAQDGIDAGVAGIVSDDGTQVMPKLGDAQRVVAACTSAGCQGAINNTDAFEAAAPNATVTTLIDSSFFAATEVLSDKQRSAVDAMVSRFWDEVSVPVWQVVPDAACAADHPGEEWKCMDMDVMSRNYLKKVVQHVDHSDPVAYDFYAIAGFTKIEFATAVVDTFRFYEDTEPHISMHSNNCGVHAAVDADGTFMNYTVVDAENPGEAMSLHDVTWSSVVEGERAVVIDSIPPTTSVCGLGM